MLWQKSVNKQVILKNEVQDTDGQWFLRSMALGSKV